MTRSSSSSKWSTFYNFHLGSYTILNGSPVSNNQMPGFECPTVGTQAMPPTGQMNTDPNVDWDTQGRVYHHDPAFNAYWGGGMHPNGEIDVTYSDDKGSALVEGERRGGLSTVELADEPDTGPRRGQAMDRRQP